MKLFSRVETKIVVSIWAVMLGCVIAIAFPFDFYVHNISRKIISQFAPLISDTIETKAKLYLSKGDTDSFVLFMRRFAADIPEITYIHHIAPDGNYALSTVGPKVGTAYAGKVPDKAEPGAPKNHAWLNERNLEISFPLMVPISEYLPEERNGSIVIGVTLDNLEKSLDVVRRVVFVIFALFALIMGAMVTILVARVVVSPIRNLASSIEQLTSSEGDLSKALPVMSNDQIGALSRKFNLFLGTLNRMIKEIKSCSDSTTSIGQTLAASAKESSDATDDIKSQMELIRNQTVRLDSEVTGSAELIDKQKEIIDRVNNLISAQTSDITESSTAVQQMIASIQNISKTSEKKLLTVESLRDLAAEGKHIIEDTMHAMKQVSESTNCIMKAVEVINTIAAQTDLLAMNASIEAAHAGDSGKGFSVVAGEMRKLSEETAHRSKEISSALAEMTGYIKASEKYSSRTGIFFNSMVKNIQEVRDSMVEIQNAMHEISTGSKEINTALASLVEISSKVDASSREMLTGTQDINASMSKLETISGETKNGMEEISIRLERINSAVHLVSNSGILNAANVKKIEALVDKFRVQ
jgi:methyl-accepting chemotaxis protein